MEVSVSRKGDEVTVRLGGGGGAGERHQPRLPVVQAQVPPRDQDPSDCMALTQWGHQPRPCRWDEARAGASQRLAPAGGGYPGPMDTVTPTVIYGGGGGGGGGFSPLPLDGG